MVYVRTMSRWLKLKVNMTSTTRLLSFYTIYNFTLINDQYKKNPQRWRTKLYPFYEWLSFLLTTQQTADFHMT